MTNRPFNLVLFLTILAVGINLGYIALAQDDSADTMIKRPQIKYKSGRLRDPFVSVLDKDKSTEKTEKGEGAELNQATTDISAFEVEGIIWGGKMPQAIINNKVLSVGDLIDGAQILSIDKSGVNLNISGRTVNLSAPGKSSIIEKTHNNNPR